MRRNSGAWWIQGNRSDGVQDGRDCYLHGCPCGYYGDPRRAYSCAPGAIGRYQKRESTGGQGFRGDRQNTMACQVSDRGSDGDQTRTYVMALMAPWSSRRLQSGTLLGSPGAKVINVPARANSRSRSGALSARTPTAGVLSAA